MKQTVYFFLLIGVFGCCQKPANTTNQSKPGETKVNEILVQAILWYQHSPEMQALYTQSYNIAKKALAENLKNKAHKEKKNAVVVDIDETILNNSLYEGWLYFNNKTYTDSSWNAWCKNAIAEPLPGTADFLNYAQKLGCEVFYVTNRKQSPLFEPTLENLKKFGLPFADEKHLLLKTPADTTLGGRTTKEIRRQKIEKELGYEILLLCGDQIADFSQAFDVLKGGTEQQIKDSIEVYKNDFGSRFIIIPNPMYCDWMNAIISGNDRNTSFAHLDSLRKSKIKIWNPE
jgi:5'-nucleotidase (lipoprotein e(P4) family)